MSAGRFGGAATMRSTMMSASCGWPSAVAFGTSGLRAVGGEAREQPQRLARLETLQDRQVGDHGVAVAAHGGGHVFGRALVAGDELQLDAEQLGRDHGHAIGGAVGSGGGELDRPRRRERLQVGDRLDRRIPRHREAIGVAAEPGEPGELVEIIAAAARLQDEQAGDVQDADGVAVRPRAIELVHALGAAAGRHVERDHVDLVRQVFLHRRRDRAHIGVEAAADLVRDDEGDVALGKSGGDAAARQGRCRRDATECDARRKAETRTGA